MDAEDCRVSLAYFGKGWWGIELNLSENEKAKVNRLVLPTEPLLLVLSEGSFRCDL